MGIKFTHVTRQNLCPICGKPDYCFWAPMKNGGEKLTCQRTMDSGDVLGIDGKFYIFLGFSKGDGSCGKAVYEEAEARKARLAAWNEGNRDYQPAKTQTRTLTPIDIVNPKSNDELDKIYRYMCSLLRLEPVHREYLKKEGWSDELIKKHCICSFPEKDSVRYKYRKDSFRNGNLSRKKLAAKIIEKFGEGCLKGVPGAFQDAGGNWTFAGRSGILFPLYDLQHKVYRLRLRLDYLDVPAQLIADEYGRDAHYVDDNGVTWYVAPMKGYYQLSKKEGQLIKNFLKDNEGKYRNFSSFYKSKEAAEKGFLQNTYVNGCEAGNNLGFYFDESRDDMWICYITEGEKKGIFCNDEMRAPFVNIPGVGCWAMLFTPVNGVRPIDVLIAKGVKYFVVALDADKAQNKMVFAAHQNIIDSLRQEGIIVAAAEWDQHQGKGIDDLCANGYRPLFVLD